MNWEKIFTELANTTICAIAFVVAVFIMASCSRYAIDRALEKHEQQMGKPSR